MDTVSIVVANHGRDLTELVESIGRSTVKPLELIVIDEGRERSWQRNKGIKQAVGDCIIWLDSDQSISPNLLQECLVRTKNGAKSLYIPEEIIAKSFFGKIRAFERGFYTGTAVDVQRFVVANMCPFFNEELTGPEDADWGRRIHGKKGITKSPLYHHDDIGFWDYCKKKAYYTKSMRRYAEMHPSDKCLNPWYRCFGIFTENRKWKKLVKHPILSIGVFFIVAVRGVIYLTNRTERSKKCRPLKEWYLL